jgi:hypothetical protein
MSEEWKPVEFPRYEVSNLGRVRKVDTGAILTAVKGDKGYTCLNIKQQIHRLVAQAFIPNPENKPEVDHINRVRDDNRLENLRWSTSKENKANRIFVAGKSGHFHIYIENNRNKYRLRYKAPNWTTERSKSFATLEEALVVRQQWYDEE